MKLLLLLTFVPLIFCQWTFLSEVSVPRVDMSPYAKLTGRQGSAIYFVEKDQALYVFGGRSDQKEDFQNDLWKYEMETGRWIWFPDPPQTLTPRTGFVYWTYNDKLWLFGGKNLDGVSLRELWSYCTTTRKWTMEPMPSHMPAARHHAAFWIQETRHQLFLYGGKNHQTNTTFEDLWSLDLDTLKWSPVNHGGDTPGPRENAKAVLGPGQEIVYLYGGYNENGLLVSRMKQLDLTDNIWSECPNKDKVNTPHARSNHVLWMKTNQKQVLLYGGRTNEHVHGDIWSYDITEQKWTQIDTGGPSSRYNAATCIGPRGGLYLFGGYSSVGVNDIWKYGPLNSADLLSSIKVQLDVTTVGALLAGSMSTISVAILIFIVIAGILFTCTCKKKSPLALPLVENEQSEI